MLSELHSSSSDSQEKRSKVERIDEQIRILREKREEELRQLKNRRKALVAQESKKARKARNHRLIVLGVITERHFGSGITPEEYEARLLSIMGHAQEYSVAPESLREAERQMKFVRSNAQKGYAYAKGIRIIKELGVYEQYRAEIEGIIANAVKVDPAVNRGEEAAPE